MYAGFSAECIFIHMYILSWYCVPQNWVKKSQQQQRWVSEKWRLVWNHYFNKSRKIMKKVTTANCKRNNAEESLPATRWHNSPMFTLLWLVGACWKFTHTRYFRHASPTVGSGLERERERVGEKVNSNFCLNPAGKSNSWCVRKYQLLTI